MKPLPPGRVESLSGRVFTVKEEEGQSLDCRPLFGGWALLPKLLAPRLSGRGDKSYDALLLERSKYSKQQEKNVRRCRRRVVSRACGNQGHGVMRLRKKPQYFMGRLAAPQSRGACKSTAVFSTLHGQREVGGRHGPG